jgi:anti-sigma factor RsiW
MTPEERAALIHAELDGELSSEQRAELARLLLGDPQARALRDELHAVRRRLERLTPAEPPAALKDAILSRLPPAPVIPVTAAYRAASPGRWRLAALIAGVLAAGTIVYETVQGPSPTSRETAGTMAADAATAVDSATVGGSMVAGRATLYRDKTGLSLGLEVSAPQPVDVVIAAGGSTFRIKGLGGTTLPGGARRTIALPGVGMQGQEIDLSFLAGGRTVGRATLHAPTGS